jgi:insulysin
VNSALSFFCQVGQVADDKLRATFSLFGHLAQHSVFNQLRTKEQLGYMVSAAVWHAATHMGWRIRIQSERDPEYLESRVEHFLANLQDRLETMTEEEFNRYKYSLIALKEERVRNLSDEMTKFWAAIQSGYCDFIRGEVSPT